MMHLFKTAGLPTHQLEQQPANPCHIFELKLCYDKQS